jgi:hypothetical protein
MVPMFCVRRDDDALVMKLKTEEQLNINSKQIFDLNNLSTSMNTLSCGLRLRNEFMCTITMLMSLAREMVHFYRVALIFMLMACLSVSFIQIINNFLFLPPIFSGLQVSSLVIWLIPFLSFSLIHKNETNELRLSTKKNKNLISKLV